MNMFWDADASFDEQTQHILLKFLQQNKVENRTYQQEIQKLENELRNGSRFDDDIQTDGHCPSGPQRTDFRSDMGQDQGDDELYRMVAAQLVELGDELDQSIFNRNLIEQFIHANEAIQPQEDGTRIMSAMIAHLTTQRNDVTRDMPQEKVFLLLAMMLFKKTVVEKPLLLPRIFKTTVQYISNTLQNYIQNIGGWQNIQ
ncbi:BH3-interacting domain death agonist-like isoform X2 [Rhincodon typus]|uniref:BH3-interacting domain death agonist-like isoform X2 n=1 Tax=Rhincodon typus TaxID=259920 RepID=UPI00202F3FFE|nr:BH3-interacting domain death agonist-like isoform X2 [Rhincodon typus]XP_048463468.1 BH3-interacting domain death agonist-like isoform X2 [Rhincodon typus]XP_048463469.1 BH3-interacting domain death agonist-like isoform X2 [Rhincodon typus]